MDRITDNYKYFENMVKKVSYGSGWTPHQEADVLHLIMLALCELEAGNNAVGFAPWEEGHGKEWLSYMHGVAHTVLTRYLNERQDSVVPLTRRLGEDWSRARRVAGELSQTLGREPRNREVAEAMGITLDQYEQLRSKVEYEQMSGDDLTSGDSDSACLEEDFVGFEESVSGAGVIPGPEEVLEQTELLERLYAALDTLPDRDGAMLKAYYGLHDGGSGVSQVALAEEYDVSQPRVVAILRRAEARLAVTLQDMADQALALSLEGRTSA